MRTHLHFVGCNGIPSSVYLPILQRLETLGIESTSYSNLHSFPNVKDWRACSLQILKEAKHAQKINLGENSRLIGFGHSLGGALVYGGATKNQNQNHTHKNGYDKVIIFEPPMMNPLKRLGMLTMNYTNTFKYFPPVKASLKKPNCFQNQHEAELFIRNKFFYKQFHPIILESFIKNGLVQIEDSNDSSNSSRMAYAYKPKQEADIIMSSPIELFPEFITKKKSFLYQNAICDGTLIYSTKHDFASISDINYLKTILHGPNGQFNFVSYDKAGHYAPLICDPNETAQFIFNQIQQF